MPPTISVTIASSELGLPSGNIAHIDANVRRFPREALVLRIVSVLNALAALVPSVDFSKSCGPGMKIAGQLRLGGSSLK
jgi:hypothetical protein